MQSTKSTDLIGQIKFLLWQQLDVCSVTRPILSSAKGVACETKSRASVEYHDCANMCLVSQAFCGCGLPHPKHLHFISQAALEYAREKRLKVKLTCTYLQHFVSKHPEYSDLVLE